jgi:hypothetical protein
MLLAPACCAMAGIANPGTARALLIPSPRKVPPCHPEPARSAGEGSQHIDQPRFLAFGSE